MVVEGVVVVDLATSEVEPACLTDSALADFCGDDEDEVEVEAHRLAASWMISLARRVCCSRVVW